MKRTLAILLAAAAGYGYASADASVVVASANSSASFPLTIDTRIAFGDKGVSVINGTQTETVDWKDVQSVSFAGVSGIAAVSAETPGWSLRESPVGNTIEVVGCDVLPARLSVVSLNGAGAISIDGWNGEAIDASSLPAGIYIININNSSLKFIKK